MLTRTRQTFIEAQLITETSDDEFLSGQIARLSIQESGRRNGEDRPASSFHLEVQRFPCGEGYVEDEVRYARRWETSRDCGNHERIELSSVRP